MSANKYRDDSMAAGVYEPVVWAQNPAFHEILPEPSEDLSDHMYSPDQKIFDEDQRIGYAENSDEEPHVLMLSLNDKQIVGQHSDELRDSEESRKESDLPHQNALAVLGNSISTAAEDETQTVSARKHGVLRSAVVLAAAVGGITLGVVLGRHIGKKRLSCRDAASSWHTAWYPLFFATFLSHNTWPTITRLMFASHVSTSPCRIDDTLPIDALGFTGIRGARPSRGVHSEKMPMYRAAWRKPAHWENTSWSGSGMGRSVIHRQSQG